MVFQTLRQSLSTHQTQTRHVRKDAGMNLTQNTVVIDLDNARDNGHIQVDGRLWSE